jgi:hypothetical protein
MDRKRNSLKRRALVVFEQGGWLSPRAWATLAGFAPIRAAYSCLKRLHYWQLLDRAKDGRGLLLYRLNAKGRQRLMWLRHRAAAAELAEGRPRPDA